MITKKNLLSLIWVVVSLVFFNLGIAHYNQSKQAYPAFEFQKLPEGEDFDFYNSVALTNQNKIRIFTEEFNNYVHQQNASNKKQNIYSAFGCFISSFLAIISAFIPTPPKNTDYTGNNINSQESGKSDV